MELFLKDRESDNGVDTSVERTLEKLKNNLMTTPLSKYHCPECRIYISGKETGSQLRSSLANFDPRIAKYAKAIPVNPICGTLVINGTYKGPRIFCNVRNIRGCAFVYTSAAHYGFG